MATRLTPKTIAHALVFVTGGRFDPPSQKPNCGGRHGLPPPLDSISFSYRYGEGLPAGIAGTISADLQRALVGGLAEQLELPFHIGLAQGPGAGIGLQHGSQSNMG